MTERAAQGGFPRFHRPSALAFILYMLVVAFFVLSLQGAGWSMVELIEGIPHMGRLVGEMLPPSVDRLWPVAVSILETFQMALVGTVFGVLLSIPLAILAARSQTPSRFLHHPARALIAFFRTVPDLIWALIFVASVGLGPFAGTLAIMIDTIGFCGRFFAEAMDETDKAPQEALTAIGASRASTTFCAVMPAAMPSMINTSLFSLEKATRSSVILGLVGAGGIGIELKVAMDMFQYDQASTIILSVFLLVIVVEQVSSMLRRRIIN